MENEELPKKIIKLIEGLNETEGIFDESFPMMIVFGMISGLGIIYPQYLALYVEDWEREVRR